MPGCSAVVVHGTTCPRAHSPLALHEVARCVTSIAARHSVLASFQLFPPSLDSSRRYTQLSLSDRSTRTLPRHLGLLPSIEFHRRELERELNAQLSLGLWYGLPVAPGLSVLIVALAPAPGGRGLVPAVLVTVSFAAVFAFTARANRRTVRQLREEIDELRAR